MLKEILLEFFERELLKIKEEIRLYAEESAIWEIRFGIANSAGNLCLHLEGNLKHFIGAVLGNSGYIRQRDLEFSLKNIPRSVLLSGLDETILDIKNSLQVLTEADFDKIYPLEKHGQVVTTRYMLLHLLTHLNYHLGQVNYHRRLITLSK
ncbi:MAG: DUF1572 family protein [Saprospiraceae bacterium]|nr:DUF1572 family protein [Saprospiraceae bacterium]